MTMQASDLTEVRSDLNARLALLARHTGRMAPGRFATEVDAIRAIARRHGMAPAVTVSQFIEGALARGEQGPLVHGWLSVLGDAIDSDRHDRAACDAFAALCSVRLAG